MMPAIVLAPGMFQDIVCHCENHTHCGIYDRGAPADSDELDKKDKTIEKQLRKNSKRKEKIAKEQEKNSKRKS